MRKKTLTGVCWLISLGIFCLVRVVAHYQGVRLPWLSNYAFNLFAPFALSLLLMVPMAKFNRRLLEWRKARGRDVEEEEKYETESGVISLRPVQSDGQAPPAR